MEFQQHPQYYMGKPIPNTSRWSYIVDGKQDPSLSGLTTQPPQMWSVHLKGTQYQFLIGTNQSRPGYARYDGSVGHEIEVFQPGPNVHKGWWVTRYDPPSQGSPWGNPKPFFLPTPETPAPEETKDPPPFENSQIDKDPNKGLNWPGRDDQAPPSPVDPNSQNRPARIVDDLNQQPSFDPSNYDVPDLAPGEQRPQFDYSDGTTGYREPSGWEPDDPGQPTPWDTPVQPPFDPYDPSQYTPERGNLPPRSYYGGQEPSRYGPVYGPEWNPNLNNSFDPYYQLPGTQYNPSHPFLPVSQ